MKLISSRTVSTNNGGLDGARLLAETRRATLVNILRRCPVFSELALAELHALAAITVMKFLEKGDYLYLEEVPSDGFYVLQVGAIKVYRANRDGHEQIIKIVRPAESFAEEALV